MKNTLIYHLFLLFQSFTVFSQIINIPDNNFKTLLITADNGGVHNYAQNSSGQYIKIDANNDNNIQQTEALQVAYLTMNSSNIVDLTGLEYFTNLIELYCGSNPLSNLPISTLTQLSILFVPNCSLTDLSLINLNSLTFLYCNNNQISSLNLSNNPMLVKLWCKNNNLISLNIKNGIVHNFSSSFNNDCWKTGNPNLATTCVDANELASVQNHLNNCGSVQTINITSNCGLGSEEFAANKVVLYPNPTNNFVTLHNEEGFFTTVIIYNYLGQELKKLSIVDEMKTIDLSSFTNGIYFLNLLGEKNEIVKIIKQ